MNADPNRVNRRRTVKTRSRFTTLLTVYFFVALIIPNCVLANTEPYSGWTVEALILMPLGFYMMWSVALSRSGVMIWLGFPFIFLCAFQIVLLYLFGNSIIATDMFTNLVTTNPGEAGELLSNIYPSVILVCVMYLPLLWFAAREIGHKRYISRTTRMNVGLSGAALMALGMLALWPAYHVSEQRHVLRDEIFPLNVAYNVYLSASEFRKAYNFEKTSADFTYEASREAEAPGREIYVYIIGEASRAMSWELYGYERETNPRLSQVDDLVIFRDVLTQSNTTHKSVPLILSSVSTEEHDQLYRRKGLPALFNEAGFETWFISNQSPQGAMIDKLARDADHLIYIRSPRHDMQLLDEMRRIVETAPAQKMLFILHCYGSHFTTIRSVTRTIFSPRRSPSCADCGKPPRRCSTAPTTARTFWTTTANASCTPRPPRPPISSTWPRWRGSPTPTGGIFPPKPRLPGSMRRRRPRPTPCSTPWPTWPRSGAASSIRRYRS